jgi:hypothetical protein
LYESISRRIVAVLKAIGVSTPYYKEMCIVSVVLPLFCSTPVCSSGGIIKRALEMSLNEYALL